MKYGKEALLYALGFCPKIVKFDSEINFLYGLVKDSIPGKIVLPLKRYFLIMVVGEDVKIVKKKQC